MNVLEAEDQLCQRMSWALYEHLNVGITTAPDNTETNLYSYDILTRNCFGSYFDILKEMVYNPKIGEQFNSVGSTSARQKWDVHKQLVLPDENLGREIMQVSKHSFAVSLSLFHYELRHSCNHRHRALVSTSKLFTIGMHELNYDGTEARDEFGRLIQTYDNYDIMTNARVLTGFIYTARRGNVDELFRANKSRMDPMRVELMPTISFQRLQLMGIGLETDIHSA
jgi:cullin-associated NEDD8-dissociated protein 1